MHSGRSTGLTGSLKHGQDQAFRDARGSDSSGTGGEPGWRHRPTSNLRSTGSSRGRRHPTSLPSTKATTRPKASTSRSIPVPGSVAGIARVAAGTYPIGFFDINSLVKFRDQNPDKKVQAVLMIYDKPAFAIAHHRQDRHRQAEGSRRPGARRAGGRRRFRAMEGVREGERHRRSPRSRSRTSAFPCASRCLPRARSTPSPAFRSRCTTTCCRRVSSPKTSGRC